MIPIANKRIQGYSILIMTLVALSVSVAGSSYLYVTTFEKQRIQLVEMARSQGRMFEAVGKFDAIVSGGGGGLVSRTATLSQIKEAHVRYTGFGESGEFVLAEKVGEEIVFLLPTRKMDFEVPPSLALDSEFAGPMRLALLGESGTVVAIDHSGARVLAAYEYLPFLEMGLVVKMDMSEIRGPFIRAALYTSICAWVAILVGAWLNVRIIGPLVKAVYESNESLHASEERMASLTRQLSRYLSPPIYDALIEGTSSAELGSRRRKLTVFFSDIIGFTARTERMEPEDLSFHLNSYLGTMSTITERHGGTLDKFVGDAVLIFFGDPQTRGVGEDAVACVAMACEMRDAIQALILEWERSGIEPGFAVRIGIATGYCTVGNFGSDRRMEYTVIGNSVNLASRLESNAEPGQILISEETHLLVKDEFECESMEPIQAKNVARPVINYAVRGRRSGTG